MNILFYYTEALPPAAGGTARVVHTLAEQFALRGHNIFLAFNHDHPDFHPSYPCLILARTAGSRLARRVETLSRFVLEHQIDLIIDNYHHNKLRHLRLIARVKEHTQVSIVSLYHTSPQAHIYEWSKFAKPILPLGLPIPLKKRIQLLFAPAYIACRKRQTAHAFRFRLEHYDRLILLSPDFIPEVMQMTGIHDPRRYTAIPNAVETLPIERVPAWQDKERLIIFVGSLCAIKRPDHLLQAWISIQEQYPDWSIAFIGAGPLEAPLRAYADKWAKRCDFVGFQQPDDFYRRARILLLASDYEGHPLVLMEGARYGVIPVAYDSFAALRTLIVAGEAGIAVPPGDWRALAQTIAELMRDEERQIRLSQRARNNVMQYTCEEIMPLWEALFDSIQYPSEAI